MPHVLLTIFWVLFYLVHSLLASWPIKRYIRSRWAGFFPYYRLFYNTFSLLGLLGIYFYQKNLPPYYLLSPNISLNVLGYLLLSMGIIVMSLAMARYNTREFLGFRPERELTGAPPPLVQEGLNRWVRHPLYFGAILFCIGLFFKAPLARNFIFLAVTFGYLLLGIPWEEQKLLKRYGKSYKDYQKKTPMLIPFWF